MVAEKQFSGVKSVLDKIGKRNLVLAGAAVLIGVAVWLNWSLFADNTVPGDGYDGYDQSAGMTDTYGDGATKTDGNEDSYFASTQVSRKRARDEALEVLQSVVDNTAADESV